MKALILMHAPTEGPGSLGEYLERAGVAVTTVELHAGERLPASPLGFDAVISMGGPMNVYEEERYPFLRDETAFLEEAIHADVPVLGICLGAQMIAKAAGARVTSSPAKEVGWGRVRLTDAGRRDALFAGLPRDIEVLQWHEDMFHVPAGGKLLATGTDCPHQAFRYLNALGLQFHVEVTREMLSEWFAGSRELSSILRRMDEIGQELSEQARKLYDNFLDVARRRAPEAGST